MIVPAVVRLTQCAGTGPVKKETEIPAPRLRGDKLRGNDTVVCGT